MNYKLFLLVTALSIIGTSYPQKVMASQDSTITTLKSRGKALDNQKKEQDTETTERIEKRSKGRQLQRIGGKMVEVTNSISDLIKEAPLSIQQQNPTTAVAILNRVVTGVGVTIRALGRRKEALQAIMSANEQIIEAAAKTYEKIEALSSTLETLIGPKTFINAAREVQSSDLSKGQKILTMLSPSNYINTFNKFTDDLYITDNKAKRWEEIKRVNKELQEEQSRYDDYIALLQIKFLEKMIMALHLNQNKDAYLNKLDESVKTIDEALNITNAKIEALDATPAKSGVLNKLKKVVGKDQDTQIAKERAALINERAKYIKQKESTLQEIKHYQELKTEPSSIKQERDDLVKKISEIKGRREAKVDLNDLKNEISELKGLLQSIQNDVESLKKTRPSGPQPLRLPPMASSKAGRS